MTNINPVIPVMSCLVLTSRKIKIAVVVSAEPFANLLRALVFNCFISIYSIFVVKHSFILPQRYMELIKQWFLEIRKSRFNTFKTFLGR